MHILRQRKEKIIKDFWIRSNVYYTTVEYVCFSTWRSGMFPDHDFPTHPLAGISSQYIGYILDTVTFLYAQ